MTELSTIHPPEAFPGSYLLASDFDNTIAITAQAAPNGLTVEDAYEIAIEEVLGPGSLKTYLNAGGLRNRSPIEIVAELRPWDDVYRQQQLTEDLISKKLDCLLPQFGQRLDDGSLWPHMNAGLAEAWRLLDASQQFDTAVITSGHDPVVRRFFDIHELPQPDITVTDDDMRPLTANLDSELCVKPSRLLIDMAHYRWLERFGLKPLINTDPEAFWLSRERITYAGDDPAKDGQLAKNAGVEFIHVPRDNPGPAWLHIGRLVIPEALQEGVAGAE